MFNSLQKFKFVLKFNIESNVKVLNPKISTVLSQKRINSSDFLILFKEKLVLLNIKEDVNVLLKVWLFVSELDDYILYIKMPSLTTLINRFFNSKKNYDWPGFLFNKPLKNTENYFNYIITPYILYEIVYYQYTYEVVNISFMNFFKKSVNSLSSKGINIFYNF